MLTIVKDVFADASEEVVFLRVDNKNHVGVDLVEAKAKVAPINKITINRLVLLGCLIGARLAASARKTLKMEDVSFTYWTDSTIL